MIFLIKDRLRMPNNSIVSHLTLGVLWKSVCKNNHIREIFTVLLTCGC